MRYGRLVLRLIFYVGQEQQSLSPLVEEHLLIASEERLLKRVLIGSRPIAVVMWMSKEWDREVGKLSQNKETEIARKIFNDYMVNIRSTAGSIIARCTSALPFLYVHLIFWVVQLTLFIIAFSTGVQIGINLTRRSTGNNEYHDPTYTFP